MVKSLKMNPHHAVPTLKDGDFILKESRCMGTYLADKYDKDGCKLYPKDICTRAKVDEGLYFDATGFYSSFGATVVCGSSQQEEMAL